jgi:Glycosyltransferase family 87
MDDAVILVSSNRRQWLLILISLILIPNGVNYLREGLANLAFCGDPFDLHRRWVDQQYIFRRQNPFDVLFRALSRGHRKPPPPVARNAAPDPVIGEPDSGGYPPWSFFSGAVFVGLPWNSERIYFASLDLAALGFLGWWGFSIGRAFGGMAGVFLAAAVVTMGPNRVTLSYGQYGILVNALLAATLVLEESGWPILGGLMLGIAMLKPNIAAPFLLCFFIQRRFKALASAIAYMVVASLVIWGATRTNPMEMIQQMLAASEHYVTDFPCILTGVIWLGMPTKFAIPFVAGGGLVVGAVLMQLVRNGPLLMQFAVASVIGRIWCYHRPYDDLMLIFLLLWLAQTMLKQPTAQNTIAFWLVGLSLWLPLGFGFGWRIAVAQYSAWLFGLFVTLYEGADRPAHVPKLLFAGSEDLPSKSQLSAFA